MFQSSCQTKISLFLSIHKKHFMRFYCVKNMRVCHSSFLNDLCHLHKICELHKNAYCTVMDFGHFLSGRFLWSSNNAHNLNKKVTICFSLIWLWIYELNCNTVKLNLCKFFYFRTRVFLLLWKENTSPTEKILAHINLALLQMLMRKLKPKS